ncbi:MAG TPA: endonuclease MutS2 [candidate division Zixibacteria bacterium]|nr:endonuclease MutS2 [candidate division Zixibacteria bacterium]
MTAFDSKTLHALELPAILARLKGSCLTPYGAVVIDSLAPLPDVTAVRRRLAEHRQMKDILQFGDPFPLSRTADILAALEKAHIPGARLEPEDFLGVRDVIGLAARLKAYRKDERDSFPEVAAYLQRFNQFAELSDAIARTITPDGEIKDSASPELRRLRSLIGDTRRRVISKLEDLLRRRKKTEGWQDDVVTQRSERYVIPAPANLYRSADGIVLDRSQSGATLFVEPQFAVELNNKLTLALQDERREIDRILTALTAEVGAQAHELRATTELIGAIDALHATALFAIRINAVSPQISDEPVIQLREARHPLLLYYAEDQSAVVPLDVELGAERQGLLITGPNTGGKTVALKTIGLAALLVRYGLPIAADERSVVGIFDQVFADIGDEQSIELSLSTFSSHITKVIRAVKQADQRALLLFDEIGAGTDPAEGAALAEAIILDVIQRGAKLIVTTHYSHLKTLPLTYPELDNASLEFDRESLRPTFRLQVGVPGSSYAIEIADRLGMPAEIVRAAAAKLGTQERSLSDLISSMEEELRRVRADSAELAERLRSATELETEYKSRAANLESELTERRKEALAEAEQLVKDTRAEMERVVKEIRERQAAQETVKDAHRTLRERGARLSQTKRAGQPRRRPGGAEPDELAPGDPVWINSLRVDGEVAELVGDDRVRVRVGNILNLVPRSDITKAHLPEGRTRPSRRPAEMREETAPGREIHLRGLTVEEATEKLDKFLDSAVLSDLNQVYVVHGKGAGILRKALTDFLKNHPAVKSVRLGDCNQGGAGVTVVQLK